MMRKVKRHLFRKMYKSAMNDGDWHTFDWDSYVKKLRLRFNSPLLPK